MQFVHLALGFTKNLRKPLQDPALSSFGQKIEKQVNKRFFNRPCKQNIIFKRFPNTCKGF